MIFIIIHNICSVVENKKKLLDYIQFIHKSLFKICEDSRLEGLVYHGGPDVPCENELCGHQTLHCVTYDGNKKVELKPASEPVCKKCKKKYDIDQLLVRRLILLNVAILPLALFTQGAVVASSTELAKGMAVNTELSKLFTSNVDFGCRSIS